jgi:hypothetical protein
MPLVLLATCADFPDGDEDGAVLQAALAARGLSARWAVWSDPAVDWSAGLVVLRSTWDYPNDRAAFLRWVSRLPRVANEAAIVEWNTDKVYLGELAAAGVPTVATTLAPPGAEVAFPDGGEFVVKPSVGAGSRGVGRFTADRAPTAVEHVRHLHAAGRTALVQPYLEDVATTGETALIYVAGVFTHAVRKGPMLPDGVAHPVAGDELYIEEQIAPRVPDAAELAVGAAAVEFVRERFGAYPLYARVDLLPAAQGPVVVELELTEPSLFLQYRSGDVEPLHSFADAVAGRAGR